MVDDCPNSTEEEKRKFKAEYRSRKQRKVRFDADKPRSGQGSSHKGSVRRIGADAIDSHSSLFSATFSEGAVESVVMVDQGSDGNIMPPAVFELIQQADPNLDVVSLAPAHTYSFINKDEGSGLTCRKKITADIHLRIRHGVKLILRGIEWKVSNEPAEFVVIGPELLQAIGCDNKAMLLAACDKNDGVINVPKALSADAETRSLPSGTVASLLSERDGISHSQDGAEEDDLDESGVYIDIGEDPQEDLDAALEQAVATAKQQGLSDDGAKELDRIIQKHKQIFD